MDVGNHVVAINFDNGISWCAEGRMEDRAIFRDVDFFAGEHLFSAFAEFTCLGKLDEEINGLLLEAVLGIVQKETSTFC